MASYLQANFPVTMMPARSKEEQEIPVLYLVEVADTSKKAMASQESLERLLEKCPALLPPSTSVDTITEQFKLYLTTDLSAQEADKLDANIGKNPDFFDLSMVMRVILVIPHSSAACKRVFSCVRRNNIPQRTSLANDVLQSRLIVKNDTCTVKEAAWDLSEKDLKELRHCYKESLQTK